MTETIETKIAILAADVRQGNEYYKNMDKSLEKLIEVSDTMSKLLAVHDVRIQNTENDLRHVATSTVKMDDTLSALREQIVQLKFENHVERETNHREVLGAIERSNTKITDDLNRKIAEVKTEFQVEMEKLNTEVDGLKKFKWTSLGVLSVFTVEILLRIYGIM